MNFISIRTVTLLSQRIVEFSNRLPLSSVPREEFACILHGINVGRDYFLRLIEPFSIFAVVVGVVFRIVVGAVTAGVAA